MKLYQFVFTAILLVASVACNQGSKSLQTKQQSGNQKIDAKKYTCIMHPDVLSDKPGVCPKCGMDLIEKEK